MSVFHLILSEIRFRSLNFVVCLLAIVVAATLFVMGPAVLSGYARDTREELDQLQDQAQTLTKETEEMQASTKKELAEMDKKTRRIMRDLGVNLRIVHQDTNMANLYTDFAAFDFPEDYVNKLAEAPSIETIVHLVATLQERVTWNDRKALLVGILPVLTNSQKNEEKPHMVKNIEQGTVLVGHELGIGLKAGETLKVEGVEFTIAKIMPEFGGLQDVQLMVHLHDAQRVLKKEGRINQIMALNCKCKGDRISIVRQELEGVLPDTKVTEHTTRATAREAQRDLVAKQRASQLTLVEQNLKQVNGNRARQAEHRQRQQQMLGGLVSVATPLAVFVSAIFVGLMTWVNVRERRAEIGVLRALGKGTLRIVALFLGKSAFQGFVGGLCGCLIGFWSAWYVGTHFLESSPEYFAPEWPVLAAALFGAPLVSTMAGYLPTLSAVTQDPAAVLMDH